MKSNPASWLLILSVILALNASPRASAQELFVLDAPDDEQAEELLPVTEAEPSTNPVVSAAPEPEVIRERYTNRRVKVQREVIQDASQNYINHGSWKMWDEQGNLVVDGFYEYNQRHGAWTRVYRNRDAKLLTLAPFNQAQTPIVSQATFKDGELDGTWLIYDANKRKLSEWQFVEGRRHGRSTWWYANGRKMREINYDDGAIDGDLLEWDQNEKLVKRDHYQNGRRLAKKTDYFRDKNKRSEGTVLYPKLVLDKPDDWWNCTLATYTQEGEPEKHGSWISWFSNGQRKLEGQYEHDIPVGQFVWWHANGQKSLEANYQNGKQHGTWTWWHENGQKSIQGEYANGDPSNKWLWWQGNGKVAQRADFSEPNGRMLAMPPNTDDMLGTPNASKPNGRSIK